ncbi:BQ2448_5086 [Microbotryum intermedium]|uniref:BQ2448_5086 protein n=1 Tax=Microbotryum intermedium TaxID=269621 RepID=A0A238F382_9BASI|nr:BQ2448_5086 [Microbotryum intermedium]
MTIVDPSHPKLIIEFMLQAQMASTGPQGEASDADFEGLPSYSQVASTSSPHGNASSSSASGSGPTPAPINPFANPLTPQSTSSTYAPEPLSSLNPEARKKLAEEAQASGRSIDDYGFLPQNPSGPNPTPPDSTLPTFESEELASRFPYSIDSRGNISTYSSKLNHNPSALSRFLKLHAESPPSLTIHVRGSHTEARVERRTEQDRHGKIRSREVEVREEIEDFEFYIDASEYVEQGLGEGGVKGLLYQVGGWEPAYRGGNWRIVEKSQEELDGTVQRGDHESTAQPISLPSSTTSTSVPSHPRPSKNGRWKRISLRQVHAFWRQFQQRAQNGLPSFVHPASLVDLQDDEDRSNVDQLDHPALMFRSHWVDLVETHASVAYGLTKSSRLPLPSPTYDVLIREREERDRQVREVVEQYCRCRSVWKELKVQKEVFGWNLQLLESSIRSILQTEYQPLHPTGTIQISIQLRPTEILIRPENWISRILSSVWYIKIILSVLTVYPILYLLSYFLSHRFHNLRVAFPLTRWRRIPNLDPGADIETARSVAQALRSNRTRGEVRVAKLPSVSVFDDESEPGQVGWVALIGVEETEAVSRWQMALREGVKRGVRGRKLTII